MSPSKDSWGLWVWFALNTIGFEKVWDHLRMTIEFAKYFQTELSKNEKFEVLERLRDMPLVLFKVWGHSNQETSDLMKKLNATKEIFLVSSVLNGVEYIWLSVGT